jgi:hypothetical protein
MEVLGKEVTFRTPFGNRRLDVVLRNLETGNVGGVNRQAPLSFLRSRSSDEFILFGLRRDPRGSPCRSPIVQQQPLTLTPNFDIADRPTENLTV